MHPKEDREVHLHPGHHPRGREGAPSEGPEIVAPAPINPKEGLDTLIVEGDLFGVEADFFGSGVVNFGLKTSDPGISGMGPEL